MLPWLWLPRCRWTLGNDRFCLRIWTFAKSWWILVLCHWIRRLLENGHQSRHPFCDSLSIALGFHPLYECKFCSMNLPDVNSFPLIYDKNEEFLINSQQSVDKQWKEINQKIRWLCLFCIFLFLIALKFIYSFFSLFYCPFWQMKTIDNEEILMKEEIGLSLKEKRLIFWYKI